jgi:hypothetical protein
MPPLLPGSTLVPRAARAAGALPRGGPGTARGLQRRRGRSEENVELEWFDRVRAGFECDLLAAKSDAGRRSPLPVFIVGIPRSGTTLVEQILASHPSVHGAGELDDLPQRAEQLRAGAIAFPESVRSLPAARLARFGKTYTVGLRRRTLGVARITNKAVAQFLDLELIHLALPEARIIHVTRDALDTCFSCYSTLFLVGQHYTYDLGELGRYYRAYADLMSHWREVLPPGRMLEISYAAVVADVETAARRLVAFCGLKWDPRCLAFHESQRPVLTASAAQCGDRSTKARAADRAPTASTSAR